MQYNVWSINDAAARDPTLVKKDQINSILKALQQYFPAFTNENSIVLNETCSVRFAVHGSHTAQTY